MLGPALVILKETGRESNIAILHIYFLHGATEIYCNQISYNDVLKIKFMCLFERNSSVFASTINNVRHNLKIANTILYV